MYLKKREKVNKKINKPKIGIYLRKNLQVHHRFERLTCK